MDFASVRANSPEGISTGVVYPLNPNSLGIRGVGFRAGHFFLFEVGGACLAKEFEARRGGLGICLICFVIHGESYVLHVFQEQLRARVFYPISEQDSKICSVNCSTVVEVSV